MVPSLSRLKSADFSVTNKKNGLPLELWRIVLSYLTAKDLCNSAQVCKDWMHIETSLDSTRWKALYFRNKPWKHWKHPSWPNGTDEPPSWKAAYRRKLQASKLWLHDNVVTTCFVPAFFKRKRCSGVIHVGAGYDGKGTKVPTLRQGLGSASPYDKILLYPGTYQQESTLVIKFPVAIIGMGDPSKIIIMTTLDLQAQSGKIQNVTLKPSYPRSRGRGSPALLAKVSALS